MTQINIYVKSIEKNDSNSINSKDHNVLKYMLPQNCLVKDLLNTVNQFKSPKNQINKLYNSDGIFNLNELLKPNSTYFFYK